MWYTGIKLLKSDLVVRIANSHISFFVPGDAGGTSIYLKTGHVITVEGEIMKLACEREYFDGYFPRWLCRQKNQATDGTAFINPSDISAYGDAGNGRTILKMSNMISLNVSIGIQTFIQDVKRWNDFQKERRLKNGANQTPGGSQADSNNPSW
jgi:hypothetical protein